jgi:hypothetical protein
MDGNGNGNAMLLPRVVGCWLRVATVSCVMRHPIAFPEDHVICVTCAKLCLKVSPSRLSSSSSPSRAFTNITITTMTESIQLYAPGALPAGVFDHAAFLGTWTVAWSTLPMWRVRRTLPLPGPLPPSLSRLTTEKLRYAASQ